MSTNDRSDFIDFNKEKYPHTFRLFETYPKEVMTVHLNIARDVSASKNVDSLVEPIFFDTLIEVITNAMIKDNLIEKSTYTKSGFKLTENKFLSTSNLDRATSYKNTAISANLLAKNIRGKMGFADRTTDPIPESIVKEAFSFIELGMSKLRDYKPTEGFIQKSNKNDKLVVVDLAYLIRVTEIDGE